MIKFYNNSLMGFAHQRVARKLVGVKLAGEACKPIKELIKKHFIFDLFVLQLAHKHDDHCIKLHNVYAHCIYSYHIHRLHHS